MTSVTQYNGLENIFLLASFADSRYMRLLAIPLSMSLDGNRAKKEKDPVYICQIQYDNAKTDDEMRKHFSDGVMSIPPEVTELHMMRCRNSGVAYCLCTPGKRFTGITGEPI